MDNKCKDAIKLKQTNFFPFSGKKEEILYLDRVTFSRHMNCMSSILSFFDVIVLFNSVSLYSYVFF